MTFLLAPGIKELRLLPTLQREKHVEDLCWKASRKIHTLFSLELRYNYSRITPYMDLPKNVFSLIIFYNPSLATVL